MATVFALAGIVIAADAVRSWHRTMGAAFALASGMLIATGCDAVRSWHRTMGAAFALASGMLIATGFVTVALLVLHWAAPSTS